MIIWIDKIKIVKNKLKKKQINIRSDKTKLSQNIVRTKIGNIFHKVYHKKSLKIPKLKEKNTKGQTTIYKTYT